MSLGAITDAYNAVTRLNDVFTAELLTESRQIHPNLPVAIRVSTASFTWDGAPPSDDQKCKKKSIGQGGKRSGKPEVKPRKPRQKETGPTSASKAENGVRDNEKEDGKDEEMVFKLQGIDLEIPRGQLCAIVGPVGSGKSSLLQGLLGEMRRTEGEVAFGGSISYAAQTAWIQSTSIRDNVLFGRPFEEERYWKAIHDAGLMGDLDILPQGDRTEVGEKGISL